MIKYLLHPFTIYLLLLLAASLFFLLKRKKAAKIIFIVSAIWLLTTTNHVIPNALVSSLEDQYPSINPAFKSDSNLNVNIIVLGAGATSDDGLYPNDRLSNAALKRLIEGIRIHFLIKNSKLILSGYSKTNKLPQTGIMFQTAASLGVNEKNIFIQSTPLNTFEEAKVYAEKYNNTIPLILVTSAVHMPRAMMFFRNQNLNPVAAPTDHMIKTDEKKIISFIPSIEHMSNMHEAVVEYVGILYARTCLLNN